MLTIRTRNSRLMQDLDNLIRDTIKFALMGKLGIPFERNLRKLEYFIMYTPGRKSKKKIAAAVYVRKRGQQTYVKMTAEEIEITGASLYEFIYFLKSVRSRRVRPGVDILENL